MRMVRAAILDDYQNVALKTRRLVPGRQGRRGQGLQRAAGRRQAVIKALQGFTIVNMMRERTPFTRKVIDALPDLKLLITTGARNNSIDMKAAAERGITGLRHRRLRQPDRQHRLRPDAGARPATSASKMPGMKAGAPWQIDHRPGPRRQDARHPRPRQARPARRRHRQGVRHEGDRLEPEPDAGKGQGSRRRLRVARKTCSATPTSSASTSC